MRSLLDFSFPFTVYGNMPYTNQDAFVERWIGSIKGGRGECLNRFYAIGQEHLDYLVSE